MMMFQSLVHSPRNRIPLEKVSFYNFPDLVQLLHYNSKAILSSSSLMSFFFVLFFFNLSQLLLSEQDCLLKPSKNDKSKRLFFFYLQPQSLTSKPELLFLILCPTPLLSLTKQPHPLAITMHL